MGSAEEQLKDLILSRYKSVREFTGFIDMPYSTFDSILKRGIANSNVTNVLKISSALGLSAEELACGRITAKASLAGQPVAGSHGDPAGRIHTIAAHFDGDEYTEEELDEIQKFAEFVKQRRKQGE